LFALRPFRLSYLKAIEISKGNLPGNLPGTAVPGGNPDPA